VWLGAVDTFIEEARFADAERLLQHIRRFKLSARAKAQVELARAEWHEKRGESNLAVRAYQRSIAGFRGLGDANAEALASNSLALLLKEMGRYNEATRHYRVAARLYRRMGDEESYGDVLSNQGGIADAQRDWASAIPYYDKAIRAFTRVGAKKKLAGAYNNFGVAHEMLNDLDQAETWYLKCVESLDEIGESYSEQGWRILSNLGQLYAKRKNWDKAVRCNKSSLEVADELDSNWHRAMSWNNLGTLWEERGDKRQAADCFREALRFQVETTDRFSQATVLNN
jgi:tetratricopeptide (TPR) repeat protein